MKKLLASVLAAVLAFGTATVAFADNTVLDVSLEYDLYQMGTEYKQVESTPIGYDPIKGGVTLYIPVTTKAENSDGEIKTKNTISTGYMKNYRLKLDASASKGMVKEARWQVVEGSDNREAMFVAVTLGVNNTKQAIEAEFTLTVSPKDGTDASVEGFNDEVEYEYTVFIAPGSGAAAQPATGSGTTTAQPSTGSGTTASQATTSAIPASAASDVAKSIADAKKNGIRIPRADVNVTNESGIAAKDLQTLVTAAKNAGGTVRILADSTEEGKLVGRLYIEPGSTAAVTKDISYGVSVSGGSATKAMFEKYYDNKVVAVHLTQDGTFGLPVEIAVKADLSELDTKNLMFYSYNRAEGKYYAITPAQYRVDEAGFLHIFTTLAGDIVITDKALAAK